MFFEFVRWKHFVNDSLSVLKERPWKKAVLYLTEQVECCASAVLCVGCFLRHSNSLPGGEELLLIFIIYEVAMATLVLVI